jgi:hypothetical protein
MERKGDTERKEQSITFQKFYRCYICNKEIDLTKESMNPFLIGNKIKYICSECCK